MNYGQLGVIGVRLLAVWMVASAITVLPRMVDVLFLMVWFDEWAHNSASMDWMSIAYPVSVADRLVIALLLWVFSGWLSRRLVPVAEDTSARASSSVLVQGAIAMAGLVIAVTTIPLLTSQAINLPGYLSGLGAVQSAGAFALQAWSALGKLVILFLLGVALMIFARSLHNLIFRHNKEKTRDTSDTALD